MKRAFLFFVLGVLSVALLMFSAYLGASDECSARGYNAVMFGEYGVYCIRHEEKPPVFGEF